MNCISGLPCSTSRRPKEGERMRLEYFLGWCKSNYFPSPPTRRSPKTGHFPQPKIMAPFKVPILSSSRFLFFGPKVRKAFCCSKPQGAALCFVDSPAHNFTILSLQKIILVRMCHLFPPKTMLKLFTQQITRVGSRGREKQALVAEAWRSIVALAFAVIICLCVYFVSRKISSTCKNRIA